MIKLEIKLLIKLQGTSSKNSTETNEEEEILTERHISPGQR